MSKDKFILSAGQSHELELALNRPENGAWTPDLVHRLTQGNFLGQVRQVLLGNGSIVIDRTIDCDAHPYQLNNFWVLEQQKGGLFNWNANAVELWLSEEQWRNQTDGIEPIRVLSDLKIAQKVPLNANVLDFLLENQDLIPDSWKGLHVYFWGTIYHDNTGEKNGVVRYLYWSGRKGEIGGNWRSEVQWIRSQQYLTSVLPGGSCSAVKRSY